jgi:hypothetical protein
VHEHIQFLLGNRKFREATIQTDQKLWKNPNYGFVQPFESREVNRNLTVERAPVG